MESSTGVVTQHEGYGFITTVPKEIPRRNGALGQACMLELLGVSKIQYGGYRR